jgi:hypothetical protein
MSITQALAELKLLRKRFENCLEDAEFVTLKTKARQLDVAAFGVAARVSYQSYRDLLSRYNRIKAAIVVSNATAKVTVAGREYTLAEAVERKRTIATERECLRKMQEQWQRTQSEYEAHQREQQLRVDRLMMQELGKDKQTNVEVANSLQEAFLDSNKAEVVDPLKLEGLIREFKKELEDFETNVDWVLSESNGRTMVTV